MKKHLIHPCVLAPACIAWTVFSIYLCVSTGEWQWLSRSGAITILCGAALTVRRLLILGPDAFFEKSQIINGGHCEPTAEELEDNRQAKIDSRSLHIGSWLVIIGTFIAGYGDWLPHIFP